MPKRKRETERVGAHSEREPTSYAQIRKSARLSEQELRRASPVQDFIRQKREKALPSPSTTGSAREDPSKNQRSESKNQKSTNETRFESDLEKAHGARFDLCTGNKQREKKLGQAGVESRNRLRKDGSSKQESEVVIESESLEEALKKPQGHEIERKEEYDPIRYWAAHSTWPENFAEYDPMTSSNSTNKRARESESSRSYSQSRKDGDVPEQYTAAYETYIFTKGLDMDDLKGEACVSEKSKKLCIKLLQITYKAVNPTIFPITAIRNVIHRCRNRNEAIVNRDITPMMIPPITSLYFNGDSQLEHVVDEVNAGWYDQCVLGGPRIRPDLAIGLFSSAFTEGEIEKLKRYSSVDNWTQVTFQMFFPFLMCEVKCGREGLDAADRQNMHSCSVAVRSLLRLEQEADKYRSETKLDGLNGQVLVFSISHDQRDARLYGHYAVVQGEKWTYYRYPIRKFDLTKGDELLAIHNFVRNMLNSHLSDHVGRLKDAIAALPDPSGLSLAASVISLDDDGQNRDKDGFVIPSRPDNSLHGRGKKRGQDSWESWERRESQLVESWEKRESQLVESWEKRESQLVESQERRESQLVERIDMFARQLQEEKEERWKREEENLKREETLRKREETLRQEHKEEMNSLLRRFLDKATD